MNSHRHHDPQVQCRSRCARPVDKLRRREKHVSLRCQGRGQALLEGMVGLVALAVLFWAIPVLGRYQDIALQTAHASRYAAFLTALGVPDQDAVAAMTSTAYFSGSSRRWRTASGQALMPLTPGVSAQRVSDAIVAQPGAGHAAAAALRREWQVGDDAILHASVEAQPHDVLGSAAYAPGSLQIRRSTAILTGAGHAVSDIEAQQRVGQGESAWALAARRSASAGRDVASRMEPVDDAWGRAHPHFDWLSAWPALVPADRLVRRP